MDREKKKQLDDLVYKEISSGILPGYLIGTKKDGSEEIFSYGMADKKSGLGMERDTIFRLHSMSKPICAVAVWILIERKKLSLDMPLASIFPEFENMYRWSGKEVVSVTHPITIRHLLNMTAGFTYDDDDYPGRKTGMLFKTIHNAIDEKKEIPTREVIRMLSRQPLADEPGKRWRYGLCADVLGAVIEKVDGRRLGNFYKEEIFEPLGMKDTGFYVPEEKCSRFSPLYAQQIDSDGKCVLSYDKDHHLGLGDFLSPPAYESAGAGLVSTYDDYVRFAWMLASGGIFGKRRILQEETIDNFTKNQLDPEQTSGIYFPHMHGYGYGNLMRVCMGAKDAVPGTKGSFGWDGWSGTFMSVDRVHRSVLLYFIQISSYSNWPFNSKILGLFME